MTALAAYLAVCSLLAVGPVEVSTLAGVEHKGELVELNASGIKLQAASGEVSVPLSELMEVRLQSKSAATITGVRATVALSDGSKLSCSQLRTTSRQAELTSKSLGALKLPVTAVASVRFAAADERVDEAWNKLCDRELTQDFLVVRKGDVLDHIPGVVGDVDAKGVKFVVDGDEITVALDKLFGVVYARPRNQSTRMVCRVELVGGDELAVETISGGKSGFEALLSAGAHATVPLEAVERIDFSLGKIRYLSDIEPREVTYTPFFDVTWKYQRDRNLDGGPLHVGGKDYARGLSIHSKTFLRYRLAGEYRRLQAVVGIDRVAGKKGDVHLTISADGKAIFEADVRGTDLPRPLDLDVAGVRDLDILVDFGGDLDIADHLDLADARVLK